MTSPTIRVDAWATLILLHVIWFEFIEQHEGEYCPATKWLDDDYDKAPIVNNILLFGLAQ